MNNMHSQTHTDIHKHTHIHTLIHTCIRTHTHNVMLATSSVPEAHSLIYSAQLSMTASSAVRPFEPCSEY